LIKLFKFNNSYIICLNIMKPHWCTLFLKHFLKVSTIQANKQPSVIGRLMWHVPFTHVWTYSCNCSKCEQHPKGIVQLWKNYSQFQKLLKFHHLPQLKSKNCIDWILFVEGYPTIRRACPISQKYLILIVFEFSLTKLFNVQ
jgi:hypothetical protein